MRIQDRHAINRTTGNIRCRIHHIIRKIVALINIAVTDTAEYVAQNRQLIPLLILAAARIALGIVLAFFSIHIISTAYGEIAEEIVLQAGAAVAVLAFLVVFMVMAYGLFLSWGHLRATWHEQVAMA